MMVEVVAGCHSVDCLLGILLLVGLLLLLDDLRAPRPNSDFDLISTRFGPEKVDFGSESGQNQVKIGFESALGGRVRRGRALRGRSGWNGPLAPRKVLTLGHSMLFSEIRSFQRQSAWPCLQILVLKKVGFLKLSLKFGLKFGLSVRKPVKHFLAVEQGLIFLGNVSGHFSKFCHVTFRFTFRFGIKAFRGYFRSADWN